MYPICDTVEKASTFLMSCWAQAMVAATNAVTPPTMAMTSMPAWDSTSRWFMRARR